MEKVSYATRLQKKTKNFSCFTGFLSRFWHVFTFDYIPRIIFNKRKNIRSIVDILADHVTIATQAPPSAVSIANRKIS